MGRLTKNFENAIMLCPLIKVLDDENEYCQSQNCDCDNCKLGKQLVKLAKYENAEEQGLLLKLPCKVGDDIWCIEEFDDGFGVACYRFMSMVGDYCFVTSFFAHCESYEVQLEEMVDDCENWGHTDITVIHKSKVFPTKAEAEKALEEMEK